jgi:hypothetical protein
VNATAPDTMFGFGVISQNAPHHRRGNGEEVRTAFPRDRFLIY